MPFSPEMAVFKIVAGSAGTLFRLVFSGIVAASAGVLASEPPVVPVGLDAYRMWDRWPEQRIGVRAYMRSTYDRRGGNPDESHFLYQTAEDRNVTLDVAGAGIVYFERFNHWHGSPWHEIVDGEDHVIRESATAGPTRPPRDSVFIPADLLPAPLAYTWAATRGADLIWVPIPFERSFQLAYGRTHYGTGYYIYDQVVRGIPLSQPIRSWDGAKPPAQDVLDLLSRAGSDLAPPAATRAAGVIPRLARGQASTVADLSGFAGVLRKLSFTVPADEAIAFGRARLRVTWDHRSEPSIDAPVALFFGAGTLFNRDSREYLVKAFPDFIRFHVGNVELACFFPMPFFRSARIELVGPEGADLRHVAWEIKHVPLQAQPAAVGYFHATYRDMPTPEAGRDLVLLDTRSAEGGGTWSGSFVGTSFIFSDRADLGTLEGDPRFFFDDSQTPQAQGTGTEEWCGGGDYWGGLNMTLPLAGHPVGARDGAHAVSAEDKIESAYRFLLADLMPFGRNAVIRLEHGGVDESTEHYQTVAFWYGAPAASLLPTDSLKVGDRGSEAAHSYRSPQASAPYSLTSRYEWGPDTLPGGGEIYPAETDTGRKTTGTTEFELKLEPRNFGVLLRRKLDYAFPNQRAEVYVAEVPGGDRPPEWKSAGTWYLAGSNTCVYSNPKSEIGPAQHILQTSNRRFRDDEFLVPRDLTEGRSAIRVRIVFTPVDIPLFPGHPPGELAWSEIRYDAYCFESPDWNPGP